MSEQIQDIVVLLVEDDPSNILVAQKMLQFMGIRQCIALDSGVAALDFIRRQGNPPQRIDLALLDVRMPDVDGFMVLKAIRAVPGWAGLRAVALTASIMPDEMAEAERAGFECLIGKPLDMDRFPDQIMRVLAGERVWEPE
jgi:CheY-like chemotaxis protein